MMNEYKKLTKESLKVASQLFEMIYSNEDSFNTEKFIESYPFKRSFDEEVNIITEYIDTTVGILNIDRYEVKVLSYDIEYTEKNLISIYSVILKWFEETKKLNIEFSSEENNNIDYYIQGFKALIKGINNSLDI